MKIGYSVEGSTDRAFLYGLKQRWHINATLIEGSFRGKSKISLRRDVPKICKELTHKEAEVIIFLTDANDAKWRKVQKKEYGHVPGEFRHKTVYGVADRNIDCWLAIDKEYLAKQLNISADSLNIDDPKRRFETALGISRDKQEEKKIALIVENAPLRNWIKQSSSFKQFYEDIRSLGKRKECNIPNEWERN